jgi:hypothetical protein
VILSYFGSEGRGFESLQAYLDVVVSERAGHYILFRWDFGVCLARPFTTYLPPIFSFPPALPDYEGSSHNGSPLYFQAASGLILIGAWNQGAEEILDFPGQDQIVGVKQSNSCGARVAYPPKYESRRSLTLGSKKGAFSYLGEHSLWSRLSAGRERPKCF